MKIGIIDVDGHNFPNFALMKISAYHKTQGDFVEWARPRDLFGVYEYDKIYASKIFTFSPDFDKRQYVCNELIKGGTGYDIKSRLPEPIEACRLLDYDIYPQYNFSVQFFSRGCIRACPFCLVRQKEGKIRNVEPHQLNPRGEWIEVLDNNFFANPQWREAAEYLKRQNQPVKFHGVDVRIIDEEQAAFLNEIRHVGNIHIAWDLPQIDLRPQLEKMCKYVHPSKITCYLLIGYNSTREQDLDRARVLKDLGIAPFVQPYRDFENKRTPTLYELDFARWCNRREIFKTCDFLDFKPRKNFKCAKHFELCQ